MIDEKGCKIDSEMIYNIIVNICFYILLFACISFWLYVSCTIFMNKSIINSHFKNYIGQKNKTQNNLELYLLNHLKLAQLLIDGDVESNPGPVTNNVETPKSKGGRPKKGIKGCCKPKKLDFTSIVDNNKLPKQSNEVTSPATQSINLNTVISTNNIPVTENIPVPLKNIGENVCFFNSLAQVLYSSLSFRAHVFNTTLHNDVIDKLRELFREMESTQHSVHTYPIVACLDIPEYEDKQQFDVRNLLSYLLDYSFEQDTRQLTMHTLFKINEIRSTMCGNCNKESFSSCDNPMFDLDIYPFERQTIRGLLDRVFDVRGYPCPDYRCEIERDENGIIEQGCNVTGLCTKSVQLTPVGDFMIIHLKITSEDDFGRRTKLFPDMRIDQELQMYGYFDLQGIIWYHGPSIDSGHYTCNVKVNGIW